MKNEKLFAAIGQIDEDMIAAAVQDTPKQKKPVWIRYTAIAAALAVVVGAGALLHQHFSTGSSNRYTPLESDGTVYIGGIARKYKNSVNTSFECVDRTYPWECRTDNERYRTLEFNGTEYTNRFTMSGETLDASYVGEKIGTGTVSGHDSYMANDEYHAFVADVYSIRGIQNALLVAVDFGYGFRAYGIEAYQPPADFGTFWEGYNLAEYLQLDKFSYEIGYDAQGYYTLTDAAYIMEILQSCGDAPILDDGWVIIEDHQQNVGNGSFGEWLKTERNSVSFTVTSEALGVYKNVFSVTDDGYICTNIMRYGYCFDIGEETAAKIMDYAMQHRREIPVEPFYPTLSGQIVAIEDDCILIDDSMLCENPEEGIVFRVPTEDIRISRHVGYLAVGDWVMVTFADDVDADNNYTVNGAFDIEKGELYDGKLLIPE